MDQFQHRTSVVEYSHASLKKALSAVKKFSELEGLGAHVIKTLKLMLVTLSVIIGIVAISVVGLIVSGNYLNRKSKRAIVQLVSELKPGTSFANVKLRLGEPSPSQIFTNAEELEMWGTTKDKAVTTNCLLYKFMHRGIPYRWVLIYTDRNSNVVVFADWQDM